MHHASRLGCQLKRITPLINRRQQSGLSAAVHASTYLPDRARLTLRASPPLLPASLPPAPYPAAGSPSTILALIQLLILGEPLPVPAVHHPHRPHDFRGDRPELPRSAFRTRTLGNTRLAPPPALPLEWPVGPNCPFLGEPGRFRRPWFDV